MVVVARLTRLASRWLLFLTLPMDACVLRWDGPCSSLAWLSSGAGREPLGPSSPPPFAGTARTALPLAACGGTWLHLQPRWCLVLPNPAGPPEPYQPKFLAVRGFPSLRLLEGSSPAYAGLQSALAGEDLPLASSRSSFPSSGFALLGIPTCFSAFLCSQPQGLRCQRVFCPGIALFSMAGCLRYLFDL